ncbi:organic hydroperoxide resistance protein [Flavihumibacter solisilvae]|uniref:Peroxiredoxin n=1 Tax=Flavihumibacter solisilvae TaxID=1349421 RepID=A0A0C1IU54_9BACT|nr:organic hydroperoxide resistance protein [Flavihumibacter solisilvae]KIC93984.1 peroxiredoxin [Flavihumibacter solisilvae]
MQTAIRTGEQVLYTAKTHTTGGRNGASKSSDGRLDLKLTHPGGKGEGTNPEQLFATGWSACFISALEISAAGAGFKLPAETAIDAEIDLAKYDQGYFLKARMNVSLPGLDRETAFKLIEEAHNTCPYSKLSRGNIDVEFNLI